MRNRPPYPLTSVDRALQLIEMLRDLGPVRVTDAAEHLGVSRSTAHRVLAMLVYRGFAVQGDRHVYLPGPSMVGIGPPLPEVDRLRSACTPVMTDLRDLVDETVNLTVRVGAQVRFLVSVESRRVLRVGDRRGAVLPAARTSGGKVLLADLAADELATALGYDEGGSTDPHGDLPRLVAELQRTRRRGYGVNAEETEEGVHAIGVAVRDETKRAVGAMSIAMPSARYSHREAQRLLGELRSAVAVAGRRYADADGPTPKG